MFGAIDQEHEVLEEGIILLILSVDLYRNREGLAEHFNSEIRTARSLIGRRKTLIQSDEIRTEEAPRDKQLLGLGKVLKGRLVISTTCEDTGDVVEDDPVVTIGSIFLMFLLVDVETLQIVSDRLAHVLELLSCVIDDRQVLEDLCS